MNIVDILLTLGILLVLAIMIVPATIDFIIKIKCPDLIMQYKFFGEACWGMKGCGNENCRLRRFCPIYQNAITPEVATELEHLLQDRCKELEKANQRGE